MIGFLTGKIHSTSDSQIIIDVNGVGYQVFLAKNTLLKIGAPGEDAHFEIYTHVNESAFQLYGFQNPQEKKIFQRFISVSGVGPKLALSILSAMPLNNLINAVIEGNLAVLTSISGVGKKTAERILVELRDKFKDEGLLTPVNAANDDVNRDFVLKDVTSALITLGYPENQAKRIVGDLTINPEDTIQSLIKKSLMRLR